MKLNTKKIDTSKALDVFEKSIEQIYDMRDVINDARYPLIATHLLMDNLYNQYCLTKNYDINNEPAYLKPEEFFEYACQGNTISLFEADLAINYAVSNNKAHAYDYKGIL